MAQPRRSSARGRAGDRLRGTRSALSRVPGLLSRVPGLLSRVPGLLSRVPGLLSRVPGLMRRHWLLAALLLCGLALRVVATVAYRPALFYIDSVASYLQPLPTLNPTGQDPIGYDLYLLRPLLAFADLTTVVVVQHLLGLAMAVAGYVLLVHKGAPRWLAAAATAPVLLDAYQLQIEQNIMSEPLFEALLVAALMTLAWRSRPARGAAIVAGLLIGMAATVRQAGELVVAPVVIYALLAGGGAWRPRLARAALTLVAFVVPVAGYMTYYHSFTDHFALSHVGGSTLYGRVAPFADCTGLQLPADERSLCPTIPRDQRPGPDYWAHDPRSPLAALQQRTRRADALSQDFAQRIIRHQPLDFAAAVAKDAVKVFRWDRLYQSPSDPPVDRWEFQVGHPLFPPLVSMDEITSLSHQYGDGDPATVPALTRFLRGYQRSVGYTPGPVLAVAILFALAPLICWRRSGPGRLPGLLFLTSGAAVLLSGDLTLFSWRYQLPGYVLLPLAGALGLTAIMGRGRPARGRSPDPEPRT